MCWLGTHHLVFEHTSFAQIIKVSIHVFTYRCNLYFKLLLKCIYCIVIHWFLLFRRHLLFLLFIRIICCPSILLIIAHVRGALFFFKVSQIMIVLFLVHLDFAILLFNQHLLWFKLVISLGEWQTCVVVVSSCLIHWGCPLHTLHNLSINTMVYIAFMNHIHI